MKSQRVILNALKSPRVILKFEWRNNGIPHCIIIDWPLCELGAFRANMNNKHFNLIAINTKSKASTIIWTTNRLCDTNLRNSMNAQLIWLNSITSEIDRATLYLHVKLMTEIVLVSCKIEIFEMVQYIEVWIFRIPIYRVHHNTN